MPAGRAYSEVDDGEVFRVRLTTHLEPTPRESVRGPYRTVGAARGVATRELRYQKRWSKVPMSAVVERATTTWTEVPE